MRSLSSKLLGIFALSVLLQCYHVAARCQLDHEAIKQRRLEGIRAQLLSKLGLNELPHENSTTTPSTEQMELFWSISDFVEGQAQLERMEADDWHAQDVVKVYPSDLSSDQSQRLRYDLEDYNLNGDDVISATLRVHHHEGSKLNFKLGTLMTFNDDDADETFVTLHQYEQMGDELEGWKSFDVTNALQRWSKHSRITSDLELRFEDPLLHSISTNGGNAKNLNGRSKFRNREIKDPHLMITTRTGENRGRSINPQSYFEFPSTPTCKMSMQYVDFKRDLNWNWIVAPAGYMANYCAGHCTFIRAPMNMDYAKLEEHRQRNPNASPRPACVPKQLAPLTIMYKKNGEYRIQQLTDLLVISCGCA